MDLYAKLSLNMEELASSFDSRMQVYEGNLKTLSATNTTETPHRDLTALSREFTDFKSLVWKTLSTMRLQLELLVQGVDRQETASRRKVLLFHGLAESSDTAVADSIIELLHSKFKMCDISTEHFASCHRLGLNSSKPRPVMVRFVSYRVRSEVWNAKTALKSSGITVSEFLTKSRHEVFAAARKHFGLRKCWTSEGKIVIVSPDNKRHRLESMSELKPLLLEYPMSSGADLLVPGTSRDKVKSSALPASRSARAETKAKRAAK